MLEEEKLNNIPQLYNMAVKSTNDKEKSEYKMAFYPIIDPRAKLPENFPPIDEYVKKLGKSPKFIQYRFEDFTVVFKNGLVLYQFDEEDFHYYPNKILLLKPNTINKIETEITFTLLKDEEIDENGIDWNTHYLISENRVLRVNIPDSNTLPYLEKE